MIERPSPNFDERPPGRAIDIVLLHYTGMTSAEAALARLCDPAAKVSAHYVIDEGGAVYRLVDERERAWHAGVAFWQGATDINARSIGIELVNPGHEFGYRAFPFPQMAALLSLLGAISARHAIPATRYLGHSDVAPLRRADPGELFDWGLLAQAGFGRMVRGAVALDRDFATLARGADDARVGALQERLARFGYRITVDGRFGEETEAVVRAFQRHFRRRLVDGVCDAETRAVLDALLREGGLA